MAPPAALVRNGRLQCAPIDYEWTGVAVDRAAYDKQRDAFAVTGSPRCPRGSISAFNFTGSNRSAPAIFAAATSCRGRNTGPGAVGYRGLRSHEPRLPHDLWHPLEQGPPISREARLGGTIRAHHRAGDLLGTLTREWIQHTGLGERRASRVRPARFQRRAPRGARAQRRERRMYGALTGTWFVAMRSQAGTARFPKGFFRPARGPRLSGQRRRARRAGSLLALHGCREIELLGARSALVGSRAKH